MAASLYVRELTASEWIVLAMLVHHAERCHRGEMGEHPQPLEQARIAAAAKPIDAPEALASLKNLELVAHPVSAATNRPMLRHWDVLPKGEAVFERHAGDAVKKLEARLKRDGKTLSEAIIKQRKRDAARLGKVLAAMEADRQEAAKAAAAAPAK